MSTNEILDNYHYLSIMLAVAEVSPKLNIARFLPPEHPNSCLWIYSDDGKIKITLNLRVLPKSPTQYQKEAFELVDYAYQNDNLIKGKTKKPTTNDYLMFCRTVDMANTRTEHYMDLINNTTDEDKFLRYIDELAAPIDLLYYEMQMLIKSNKLAAIGREGIAISTAHNVARKIFSDSYNSVCIGELKDAIVENLIEFRIKVSDIQKMFDQTENFQKSL